MCNEQLEQLLTEGELRAAISDLVPKYQQSIVIGLLDEPEPSAGSIESAGMQLLGENQGIGIIFQTGAGGTAHLVIHKSAEPYVSWLTGMLQGLGKGC